MDYKRCACCGKETLEAGSKYDYCPVCGWQDDPIQNDEPDYRGGANFITLNEAKQVKPEVKICGFTKEKLNNAIGNKRNKKNRVVQ